jgi:type IV pilus assembly protein PilB
VPVEAPKEALLKVGFIEEDFKQDFQIYGPKEGGCELCNGGYKGRVGIYQVMPVTDAISRIIMTNGNAIDIADQARKEGVNDLRRSGILKVIQGLTSVAEVEACTNE